MNWNVLISILYTTAMVIAVFVCCICDGVVSGTFSWSLIVLGSVLFTWIITFPVILLGKKGIRAAMLVMNIFIFPFLYILSILLKVDQIFSIGAVLSEIAFAFFWMLYILYGRLKNRKLLAGGITCLLFIPFMLLINFALSQMLGETEREVWDILSAFILVVMAAAFIIGDYARKRI